MSPQAGNSQVMALNPPNESAYSRIADPLALPACSTYTRDPNSWNQEISERRLQRAAGILSTRNIRGLSAGDRLLWKVPNVHWGFGRTIVSGFEGDGVQKIWCGNCIDDVGSMIGRGGAGGELRIFQLNGRIHCGRYQSLSSDIET